MSEETPDTQPARSVSSTVQDVAAAISALTTIAGLVNSLIRTARQTGELTPEQEQEAITRFKLIMSTAPHWQVEEDPKV